MSLIPGLFSSDMAIDLGTANTLVYIRGKGIVLNEPSVVAYHNKDGKKQVLAVGEDAKLMLGRTPGTIEAIRPMRDGVIADFEAAEEMIKHFIRKVHNRSTISKPKIIVCVPHGATPVEKRAIRQSVISAGARKAGLIEEPIAAAIGAGLPISDAIGNMVINVGAGSTEIAVISLNGLVNARRIPIGGDELNKNIAQYARDVFNLLLGDRIAEEIKISTGSVTDQPEKIEASMRGRDLLSGLPRQITVNDAQIREALGRSMKAIVDHVKTILETTPPELVADIYERGIVLTGGGALLRGMDEALSRGTGLPVRVAEDPLTAVVRGTGLLLENRALLNDVALPTTDLVKGTL